MIGEAYHACRIPEKNFLSVNPRAAEGHSRLAQIPVQDHTQPSKVKMHGFDCDQELGGIQVEHPLLDCLFLTDGGHVPPGRDR